MVLPSFPDFLGAADSGIAEVDSGLFSVVCLSLALLTLERLLGFCVRRLFPLNIKEVSMMRSLPMPV